MTLTIATWNINSVRLRIETVARFVAEHQPDVLCLQETKCIDGQFPLADVKRMGYEHTAIHGQKGYHGVAVFSRFALKDVDRKAFCDKNDARHIAVTLAEGPGAGTRIHNFYVPRRRDEPDPAINEKFAHKLGFLDEMEAWDALRVGGGASKTVLVGDLNIAPLEHDVWSSKQLAKVVSHTPLERRRLTEVATNGGVGRHDARAHPRAAETLHLVELPLARLGRRRQGPPPRPCLAEPGPCPRHAAGEGAARGPRLGPPVGPCPVVATLAV